jgi:hypothetical protein
VRTANPLAVGSRVRARFRLPGSARDIDADGRVAWTDRQTGMGLNFEKLDPADKAEIDAFVDAHFTPRKR